MSDVSLHSNQHGKVSLVPGSCQCKKMWDTCAWFYGTANPRPQRSQNYSEELFLLYGCLLSHYYYQFLYAASILQQLKGLERHIKYVEQHKQLNRDKWQHLDVASRAQGHGQL